MSYTGIMDGMLIDPEVTTTGLISRHQCSFSVLNLFKFFL